MKYLTVIFRNQSLTFTFISFYSYSNFLSNIILDYGLIQYLDKRENIDQSFVSIPYSYHLIEFDPLKTI